MPKAKQLSTFQNTWSSGVNKLILLSRRKRKKKPIRRPKWRLGRLIMPKLSKRKLWKKLENANTTEVGVAEAVVMAMVVDVEVATVCLAIGWEVLPTWQMQTLDLGIMHQLQVLVQQPSCRDQWYSPSQSNIWLIADPFLLLSFLRTLTSGNK